MVQPQNPDTRIRYHPLGYVHDAPSWSWIPEECATIIPAPEAAKPNTGIFHNLLPPLNITAGIIQRAKQTRGITPKPELGHGLKATGFVDPYRVRDGTGVFVDDDYAIVP